MALFQRPGVGAAAEARQPIPLCNVHGGWAAVLTPAPLAPAQRAALAAFAAELERQLDVTLKEQEERLFSAISAARRSSGSQELARLGSGSSAGAQGP